MVQGCRCQQGCIGLPPGRQGGGGASGAVARQHVSQSGSGGGRRAVAVLSYAHSTIGTTATLYTAVAAARSAGAQERSFVRMFASFKPRGAAESGASGAGISYRSWRDPAEGAFTLDVPKGWNVAGGLARLAPLDVRVGVRLTSSSLDAAVLIGDSSIPTYVEMNETLAAGGFQEGQNYSPGYGINERIMRYVPGLDYARLYMRELANRNECSGLSEISARVRPDTVAALNRINAQFGAVGANVHIDAGEISFSCRMGGKLFDGYVFAATNEIRTGLTAIWQVPYLYVATAPPSSIVVAQTVLRHVVASFQQDSTWTAKQSQLTSDSARIARAAATSVADSISSSYWARSAAEDQISQQRSDAILGRTNTVDPATGDRFKVESGSDYYWIDHSGNVVGTTTSAAPSTDFRSLVTLSR